MEDFRRTRVWIFPRRYYWQLNHLTQCLFQYLLHHHRATIELHRKRHVRLANTN